MPKKRPPGRYPDGVPKPVPYLSDAALLGTEPVEPYRPEPAPAEPAPPDLSTPEGCIAAFAALYERPGYTKSMIDDAVVDLVGHLVGQVGWDRRKAEAFMKAGAWQTAYADDRELARRHDEHVERTKPPVVPVKIDISGILPTPRPARGGSKPGLRGGV